MLLANIFVQCYVLFIVLIYAFRGENTLHFLGVDASSQNTVDTSPFSVATAASVIRKLFSRACGVQVTRARGHYYFQQRCSVRIKEDETVDNARASGERIQRVAYVHYILLWLIYSAAYFAYIYYNLFFIMLMLM